MNNIIFQSVRFTASSELEHFVNEKVSKIFDQDPSVIRAEVTLFEGAAGNPRNQFCEIQLSVPGENFFVKKNSESYEKSLLAAVGCLQKVVRRRKTKIADSRKKA
jgi:putative sigma-54 modulation protein